MKQYINFLILIGLMMTMGCSHQLTVKSSTPKKQKTISQKPPCKRLYQKKGAHCYVIISQCLLKASEPSTTVIAVAVLNTKNNGRLAAIESSNIITKYFGGKVNLVILGQSTVGKLPILFLGLIDNKH